MNRNLKIKSVRSPQEKCRKECFDENIIQIGRVNFAMQIRCGAQEVPTALKRIKCDEGFIVSEVKRLSQTLLNPRPYSEVRPYRN